MKKESDNNKEELVGVFKEERPKLLRYACYRLGNEADAEDMLQETFMKIHTRLQALNRTEIQDLRSYLFRTLTNICTKWQNSNSRIKTVPLDTEVDITDVPTPKNDEDYQRIMQLLTNIPGEQADVIRLRIYADKSFAEIAQILSLPLPTVKSRFLYGLEKIRKGIKQERVKNLKG